MHGENMKL